VPLVPTKRPKPEQPRSWRDARNARIGTEAATIGITAAMTALVGWPVGLVPAIVLGLIRGALAMIERIASARQRWAEAERAVTLAGADARVADATANADIAREELRAQMYRAASQRLNDSFVPPAGTSSLRRAADSPPPSVASASAYARDPARRADDAATAS
jgi:hypothetical protein